MDRTSPVPPTDAFRARIETSSFLPSYFTLPSLLVFIFYHNNSIQFNSVLFITVLSKQPNGQLKKQHNIQSQSKRTQMKQTTNTQKQNTKQTKRTIWL